MKLLSVLFEQLLIGIETVLVASEADADSGATRMADKVVVLFCCSVKGKLSVPELIVRTALSTSCDAVHPGYGSFLSAPFFLNYVTNIVAIHRP